VADPLTQYHGDKVETTLETLADIAVLDYDLDFRTYLEDFLKD